MATEESKAQLIEYDTGNNQKMTTGNVKKPATMQTPKRKAQYLKALDENLGQVYLTSKQVMIDASSHYRWYHSDAAYKKAVDDIQEIVLDKCEHKLHDHIFEKNSIVALLYFLKTKGKVRGYGSDTTVEYNIDYDKLKKAIDTAKVYEKEY